MTQLWSFYFPQFHPIPENDRWWGSGFLNKQFKMPFCLCWANENWSRRWDGMDDDVLMRQTYSETDDLAHIRELIPFFKDERYFKHQGRPVLLVFLQATRAALHSE